MDRSARSPAAGPASALIALRRWWHRAHVHRTRIVSLALGVFVLDTLVRLEIVVPILYVNVVLVAMRSGRRGDVLLAGWGSIVLTLVSFLLTFNPHQFLAGPTPSLAIALVNNALAVLAIVCVMVLCLMNVTSQTEIRRARDRIAQASRGTSLRTISASVVHEVTQPLTAIGANAEAANRWLSQTPPNLEETRTATRRIAREVERASHVIGRLRSMAPGAVATEICEVRVLLEEAVEHLRLEIDEAGVDVVLACPSSLLVAADRILIEQVVINALFNAMDALRTVGTRSIVIEARATSAEVSIAVKDSGVGADAATLERMFDPFFTTKIGSGMGIGLAVSRSIVEAHGGRIDARANTPRGLVVELTLPVFAGRLR